MNTTPEKNLLARVAKGLEQAPGVLGWATPEPARLVLTTRRGPVEFAALVRRHLAPAQVAIAKRELRTLTEALGGDHPLLCLERIGPALAKALRGAGIQYLDAGGNAWIETDDIALWVEGRPPIRKLTPRLKLTPTTLRVLLLALRERGIEGRTQRDVAHEAGIALGAVRTATDTLVERRLVRAVDGRRLELIDPRTALHEFAEGWIATLRPKLGLQTWRLVPGEPLEARTDRVGRDFRCLLGGELAAGLLTSNLATDHATLHVHHDDERQVVKALGLVPHPEGPIRMLDFLTNDGRLERGMGGLAHHVLILAEALTEQDERVAQAAAQLEEIWLAETLP